MPPANHVVLASGAAVAVSVAVATAIALYESPELRRYADDVRRRIAIALHSMGDGINPPHRDPLFNRPEDAHGFLQSSAEAGVDADEETKRRQREELMYWNQLRLEKEAEREKKLLDGGESGSEKTAGQSSTFDDFLQKDANADEDGSYVFNTGTDVKAESRGLRQRGAGGGAGLAGIAAGLAATSLYANPFADEHGIGQDDLLEDANAGQTARDDKDDSASDLYSATTVERPEPQASAKGSVPEPSLIDFSASDAPSRTVSSVAADNDYQDAEQGQGQFEYMTAGQDSDQQDRTEAYASIQAWAASSGPGFYSPLPSTPAVPVSEPELLSDGQLTPTDSMSLAGSGEDIADEVSRDGEAGGRPLDVMSESDGMLTPASWSEVGSVVSESDAPVPTPAHA